MSYGRDRYVSAGEKRAKAEKSIAKLRKKNPNLAPVAIEGRSIAKSWWGKAWMTNLERYADFSNRIDRGKSYVRSGAVLDLQIENGLVRSLVQGTRAKPYDVVIKIDAISDEAWQKIQKLTGDKIASLEDLLAGKFPKELETLLFDTRASLFPTPREITFACSCPDWATMCKHVAAVLYGIANRLDEDPMLFFTLRGQDGQELIRKGMEHTITNMLQNAQEESLREIPDEELDDLFKL